MYLTEEEFQKLKKNDPIIIEKIYEAVKVNILNFLIYHRRVDPVIAEDITSDAFYSAILSAGKLKKNGNIQSWLIKIADRRLVDHKRKIMREKNRNKRISQLKKLQLQEEEIINKIDLGQKALLLNMAMANINSEFRHVLHLKYDKNKTVVEIADIINKPPKTTEGILYRARKKLKEEMCFISKDFF